MERTTVQRLSLKALGLGLVRMLIVALILFFGQNLLEGDLPHNLGKDLYWLGVFSAVIIAFASAGWLTVVLPLTFVPGINKILNHRVAVELVWTFLAVSSFALLVVSWAGTDILIASWVPATIGALSGNAYRKLNRKEQRT